VAACLALAVSPTVPGPGAGHVAVYDLDGHLVQEFADAGRLNSPWGLAISPRESGAFGGSLGCRPLHPHFQSHAVTRGGQKRKSCRELRRCV